jgi:hypothetical protein
MPNGYDGSPDARQSADEREPLSRFRPRYRALSEEEKTAHDALKDGYALIEAMLDKLPAGRYRALALTALEESCMWAVKELTANR